MLHVIKACNKKELFFSTTSYSPSSTMVQAFCYMAASLQLGLSYDGKNQIPDHFGSRPAGLNYKDKDVSA